MQKSQITEMTAFKSRHFLLSWHFIIPILLLGISTVIFRSTNIDLTIQKHYYSVAGGWAFNSSPIAMFIYHYGNIPALLLCIGALGLFMLGYSKPKLSTYRKLSLYLVIAMVVGPGILVNSILKDNWGRPRPRDITQYGGDYAYEAPLTIDTSSPGKSFPCGHATMGFYFFALAFVLKQRKPNLSRLIFTASLVWGTVIGWVRIGQGGHFASDVVWAGGLVYLSSYAIYLAMGLHRNALHSQTSSYKQKQLRTIHKILLTVTGIAIALGVMLATPYSDQRVILFSNPTDGFYPNAVTLELAEANLKLNWGSETVLNQKTNGFGFPGSKLKHKQIRTDSGFHYTQTKHGFFTELVCDADLTIDSLNVTTMQAIVNNGMISIYLPATIQDTIHVSSRTKVVANFKHNITIVKNNRSASKYWFDAPVLLLHTVP